MDSVVLQTNLPLKLFARGKVRDVYDLGDALLMVATDRISAFDYVLPAGIPYKGAVLTGLSVYWFKHMSGVVKNHLISADVSDYPGDLPEHASVLAGRSMLVKKARRIDIECVVRGYISGSAWKEYKESGTVCGESMPRGLRESDALPSPLFTPAMKSDSGHDENISVARMAELIGKELTGELSELSLRVYEKGALRAKKGGIILADSKYEYGIRDGEIILIDELLTPDSSRFWDADKYAPGGAQDSFDKQFVRDYLLSVKWDKKPPAPNLPDDIVEKTSRRYLEAYCRITGAKLSRSGKAKVN
ncbi:MAG: phosphoribosylaminoimidazolesuccinocarboxamide synthase [Candidatus Altiarchaeia archaeon]